MDLEQLISDFVLNILGNDQSTIDPDWATVSSPAYYQRSGAWRKGIGCGLWYWVPTGRSIVDSSGGFRLKKIILKLLILMLRTFISGYTSFHFLIAYIFNSE